MADYHLPEVPVVEKAWRAAHAALESLMPPDYAVAPESGLLIAEVISQFPAIIRNAELATAMEIGPLISWQGPPKEKDWQLVLSGIDMDDGEADFSPVELSESAYWGPHDDEWAGSSLDLAARAYRRECGWDFAPGDAGIWLVMLAPVSGWGAGDRDWLYTGHVAGFVILYDRDKDHTYESVGHVWTARAWRHRGIARQLLAEAKSRFGYQRIEGPYTDDGSALVKALAPHDDRRADQ